MELTIYWTNFAKKELRNIFEYYKFRASVSVAKKIVISISEEVLILKNHPNIGQLEELLIDKSQEFRYLIFKNYKIIYWINTTKNRIEIHDVFDTRQNPIKLKRTE